MEVAKDLEDPVRGEGFSPSPYADDKGGITVGAGLHPQNKAEFRTYALVYKGTTLLASDHDKDLAWDNIKAFFNAHKQPGSVKPVNLPAGAYENVTNLEMDRTESRERAAALLSTLDRQLRARFSDFRSYPREAQRAVLDMAYNLGMYGLATKFPNLDAAVRRGDWLTASRESKREGIASARNEHVRNLLLRAAQSTSN